MRDSKFSADETRARKERGIAYVLLSRLNDERLPMALEMKKKVDRGEPLTAYDRSYLKQVLKEAGEVRRFVFKHPEYEDVVARMTSLYDEITRKGLENEQSSPSKPDRSHS